MQVPLPKGAMPKPITRIIALVNNTANNATITVPKHHIWWLYLMKIHNGDDVLRTARIYLRDKEGNEFFRFLATGIGAGARAHLPCHDDLSYALGNNFFPIPLDERMQIYFQWDAGGVSAGGASEYAVYVMEVPKELSP